MYLAILIKFEFEFVFRTSKIMKKGPANSNSETSGHHYTHTGKSEYFTKHEIEPRKAKVSRKPPQKPTQLSPRHLVRKKGQHKRHKNKQSLLPTERSHSYVYVTKKDTIDMVLQM